VFGDMTSEKSGNPVYWAENITATARYWLADNTEHPRPGFQSVTPSMNERLTYLLTSGTSRLDAILSFTRIPCAGFKQL